MEEYVWNSIRKGDETLYELFKISDTLNNRLIQEKGSFVLEKSQVADLRKRVENITSDLVGAFGL